MKNKLYFGKGNAKLDEKIVTFSLPAGWTCPGAKFCFARAPKNGGKILPNHLISEKDKQTKKHFRCYAASEELIFSNVRKSRWRNFNLLKNKKSAEIAELINNSLPANTKILRIHPSGDFFSQDYFDAWLAVARQNPHIKFYAYTKSLLFWLRRAKDIPENLILTASYGGKFDNLIPKNNLKNAKVVFDSKMRKLDFDDSLALDPKIKTFNLLIHGTQPAGTPAAAAWGEIKSTIGGYSK